MSGDEYERTRDTAAKCEPSLGWNVARDRRTTSHVPSSSLCVCVFCVLLLNQRLLFEADPLVKRDGKDLSSINFCE